MTTTAKKEKVNNNQKIKDFFIKALENNQIPWVKPWHTIGANQAISYNTGMPYSLANQILLYLQGADKYISNEWITYNQAKEQGGNVKKGEKASYIYFYDLKPQKADNAQPTETEETEQPEFIPILVTHALFNIEQCENIKPRWRKIVKNYTPLTAQNKDCLANQIIEQYKQLITFATDKQKAYYSPSLDRIALPPYQNFKNENNYYATAMHEMAHSTGHTSRLNRLATNAKKAAFGSQEYSKEELVAETASAMLLNLAGINPEETIENSAAYIQSWANKIKTDKKLSLISGMNQAEKAVNWILTATGYSDLLPAYELAQ